MQCTSCKNSIFYCQYCGKEIEECKKAEGEEEATITVEGENVVISYLDTMTFAEAWQKLIVDARIPHHKWSDVEYFFPVDEKGKKIKEKVTGKRVVEKTKNVLNLTSDMCGKTADELLKSGAKFFSPVAYLHWLSYLYQQEKHLDTKTWTMFPNWRNSTGRVLGLYWHPDGRQVRVNDWYPDRPDGGFGERPLIG